jgi:hypothetical protein
MYGCKPWVNSVRLTESSYNSKIVKMRSVFFGNLKDSLFGWKCFFGAKPMKFYQVLWHTVWESLPQRHGKELAAIKLAQAFQLPRWQSGTWTSSLTVCNKSDKHINHGKWCLLCSWPLLQFCSFLFLFAGSKLLIFKWGKIGGESKNIWKSLARDS